MDKINSQCSYLWQFGLLLVLSCAVLLLALCCGAVKISPAQLIETFSGLDGNSTASQIIISTRLPRIMLAGLAGMSLSLAGLAAQTLFRNPLASPYMLGVSNGSALGAVTGMLIGGLNSASLTACGIAGGIMSLLLIKFLASRTGNFTGTILLLGIASNALFSALVSGILLFAGERLQGIIFWLMGGFWRASWAASGMLALTTMGGLAAMLLLAPSMNVLLLGDKTAISSGLNLRRLQLWLLLIVAILSATVVSVAGVIGFIGLIVPHLARIICGPELRKLVPACAVGGAILTVAADMVARTMLSPAEIPVGIITSLIGAPILVWLILAKARVDLWQ
ncbi:MAG: iron ABC transporter permease [Victivallaceae bacterium]|jgi:iron complex transport system permease protein